MLLVEKESLLVRKAFTRLVFLLSVVTDIELIFSHIRIKISTVFGRLIQLQNYCCQNLLQNIILSLCV
jgi:hypothetical protein